MQKTVLKIIYSGTTVSFYEYEVSGVDIQLCQKETVRRLQNGEPSILFKSGEWKQAQVFLRPNKVTVSERVNILRQQTVVMGMQIYYSNGNLAEELSSIVLDPNIKFNYIMGYKDPTPMIKMVFTETIGLQTDVAVRPHWYRAGV